MYSKFVFFFILLLPLTVSAQSDLQKMFDTESSFIKALASNKGIKPAFLEYLSDDATVFRPNAVNGKDYWKSQKDSDPALLIRKPFYADISSNGQIGYTMGTWELYPDGKVGTPSARYGEYLTIWEKRDGGKYKATINIDTENDTPLSVNSGNLLAQDVGYDLNLRRWSVTDASMKFFNASQEDKALGKAYKKFAAEDVKLLREQMPPIIGKESVVKATKQYKSVGFPSSVSMLQSADLAYVYNKCEYADSNEGRENGNCLHVWKFRNKNWYIVAGVFARVANQTPPTITLKQKPNVKKKKKSE